MGRKFTIFALFYFVFYFVSAVVIRWIDLRPGKTTSGESTPGKTIIIRWFWWLVGGSLPSPCKACLSGLTAGFAIVRLEVQVPARPECQLLFHSCPMLKSSTGRLIVTEITELACLRSDGFHKPVMFDFFYSTTLFLHCWERQQQHQQHLSFKLDKFTA